MAGGRGVDPLMGIAKQKLQIIRHSAELEAEVSRKAPGWFAYLYQRLKHSAAEAMVALIDTDAEKINDVRALQNKVKMFDDFCREAHALCAEGVVLDGEITAEERQEMLDMLLATPGGDRQAVELGLIDVSDLDA